MEQTTIAGRPTTRLGLGCWAFGGRDWGPPDDDASRATIRAALTAGIGHLDTATMYGDGHSESLLGELPEVHRPGLFLASKADFEPTAAGLVAAVRASLARLRVDFVDLYYLHWPRAGQDLRPAMEGLERCRAAGLIGGVGVSNVTCEQMDQLRQVGVIDAHQFCYNAYWRFPERELIPYCLEHRIAGVTYSSLAQGLLTGKFPRQPRLPAGDLRAETVLFEPAVYPHLHAATEALKALAAEIGRSLLELALGWVLVQPGVDVVLVGARRPEQILGNIAASAVELEPATLAAMQAISDEAMRHVPDAGNLWRYHP